MTEFKTYAHAEKPKASRTPINLFAGFVILIIFVAVFLNFA